METKDKKVKEVKAKNVEEASIIDAKPAEVSAIEKESEIKEEIETKEEKPKESSWDTEETSPLDKKNKSFFKLGIIVLIIILVITAALFFFFLNSGSKKNPVDITSTTVEPTKAPEKERINKDEWTLEVLNGSGVAGVAAKAAEALTEQGYTVIITGNADNQNYEENELFVSENMQSKVQLLIDDLTSDYGFSSVSGALSDSTASARIILGAQ